MLVFGFLVCAYEAHTIGAFLMVNTLANTAAVLRLQFMVRPTTREPCPECPYGVHTFFALSKLLGAAADADTITFECALGKQICSMEWHGRAHSLCSQNDSAIDLGASTSASSRATSRLVEDLGARGCGPCGGGRQPIRMVRLYLEFTMLARPRARQLCMLAHLS